MSKKEDHPLLGHLLEAATIDRQYIDADHRHRSQLGWLIELAHLLRLADETGQRRKARQVKREVKEFLERLEKDTANDPADALVAQHLIKTLRNRWWGLFTCYRIPGVPATNNDQETFFNHLKRCQRRINGHKFVPDFVVRYGVYAAYLDPRETCDQLLERLRQVSNTEFQVARQAWRENEAQLHKIYRFRHHPAKFLKELEEEWKKITE